MMQTEQLSHLMDELSHPDAAQRRNAAKELAGADERAVYPLIRALRDENPGVQDAATHSLISIGGEVTAYMVLPLLREGAFLRNTSSLIVKEIGPVAVPLLRPLLADKDDDIRKFAVDLIGEIKSCDYPSELIRLLAVDPNPNVRTSAAKALGILGRREAVPALVAALRDDEWVCFSSLEALSQIGDESALEPVGALLSSPSAAIRYAAIESLGKIGSLRASEILHEYLPKTNDMEKTAAIKSLVQAGLTPSMAGVTDVLVNMLARGDWDERLIAIRGLADIQEKGAIPIIIDSAGALDPSDPTNEERLLAVKKALMHFGCAAPLREALRDPLIKYRGKVITIEVIKELGCAEAIPDLIPLLGAISIPVVLAAAVAVAQLASGDAPMILSFLREHDDQTVRERVRRLLERA